MGKVEPIVLNGLVRQVRQRRDEWAQLPIGQRIALLQQVRERIAPNAQAWVALSNAAKGIAPESQLEGEEWISGPWALLATCDHLLATLGQIAAEGRPAVAGLKKHRIQGGQLAVEVFPLNVFDRLLLSGVRAEVWMEPEVSEANLTGHMAQAYRGGQVKGELALILGAGNISSIAPLDALHKLFTEKAVCVVKLNPVNDYLLPVFEGIFEPLIARHYLHFVRGDGAIGALLCQHELVDTIHITGSQDTHDAIVYGGGEQGAQRRGARQPLNDKPITSELGAVCPTIVVPGPWTDADIRFQGGHIATQKLHNGGFNCVASQVLILPQQWSRTEDLRASVRAQMAAAPDRASYYPGADTRQDQLAVAHGGAERVSASAALARREVVSLPAAGSAVYGRQTEVFGPSLCEQLLPGADAEAFLRQAIAFCNSELRGTLGANILIHPATLKALGPRFEPLLQQLKYGCIAVNAWTGLGYLLTATPWGAFPGHPKHDVQSGIGNVHNTFMFDRAQRTVVYAPFRPFPRSLLGGSLSLLPTPPWFVNHRRAHKVARKLFGFQVRPSWFKLPGIFADALRD